MSSHFITETTVSGETIHDIVQRLEGVLEGEQRAHAAIACLSLTLVMMNPDLTADQLQEGVKDVSKYICLLVTDRDNDQPLVIN